MVHINDDALGDAFNNIGDQLKAIVLNVVNSTADQPADQAADVLEHRLADAGFTCSHAWCLNVIDTARRGDPLVINLG